MPGDRMLSAAFSNPLVRSRSIPDSSAAKGLTPPGSSLSCISAVSAEASARQLSKQANLNRDPKTSSTACLPSCPNPILQQLADSQWLLDRQLDLRGHHRLHAASFAILLPP